MSEFIQMFQIDQKSEIQDFIKDNGFVIIKDILSPEECDLTTQDINQQIKALDSRFEMSDPTTYQYMKTHGQFGMITKEPIFTHQFLMNRQNPKLLEAFRTVYPEGTKLIAGHDRFTLYRPTVEPVGKEVFKTPYKYPGLHLDMDPQMYLEHYNTYIEKQSELSYNDRLRDFISENNYLYSGSQPIYQAIINIWKNEYEDGGLQLVPGFHNKFTEWYNKKTFKGAPGTESGFHFNVMDPIDMEYVHSPMRIPLPAGAMVIWDKRLAHGSVPNNSVNARLMQFIIIRPDHTFLPEVLEKRTKTLKKILKKNGFDKNINKDHPFW